MGTKSFTITKTSHTGITVRSLEEALRFWHGLLGFDIQYKNHIQCSPDMNPLGMPDAVVDVALLRLPDGTSLELLEYLRPDDRKTYKPRPCDVGSVHLALEVTGTDALIEEAGKLGWRAVDTPPKIRRGDGSDWTVIYLHGPDGETLELLEKLDS